MNKPAPLPLLPSYPDTYQTPQHGWTCFHCGETFPPTCEGQINAKRHFGFDVDATPGCIEKLNAPERNLLLRIRALQAELDRYRDEDSDVHREMAKLRSDHAIALRREEEKGYARGLRDTRRESAARLRGLARALLFYAKGTHLVGFDEAGFEAPDEPNWMGTTTDLPSNEQWEQLMVEDGGVAAAALRKAFGRKLTKYEYHTGRGHRAELVCSHGMLEAKCRRCHAAITPSMGADGLMEKIAEAKKWLDDLDARKLDSDMRPEGKK